MVDIDEGGLCVEHPVWCGTSYMHLSNQLLYQPKGSDSRWSLKYSAGATNCFMQILFLMGERAKGKIHDTEAQGGSTCYTYVKSCTRDIIALTIHGYDKIFPASRRLQSALSVLMGLSTMFSTYLLPLSPSSSLAAPCSTLACTDLNAMKLLALLMGPSRKY